jgi:hypothetical protein
MAALSPDLNLAG